MDIDTQTSLLQSPILANSRINVVLGCSHSKMMLSIDKCKSRAYSWNVLLNETTGTGNVDHGHPQDLTTGLGIEEAATSTGIHPQWAMGTRSTLALGSLMSPLPQH